MLEPIKSKEDRVKSESKFKEYFFALAGLGFVLAIPGVLIWKWAAMSPGTKWSLVVFISFLLFMVWLVKSSNESR